MFPGQSSRYPGMIGKIAGLDPIGGEILERASMVLDRNLAAHFAKENEAAYEKNRDVQIGVFLASHLFLAMLEARGVQAEHSLGLSLGEYNHLVHIGALPFEEALRAVHARGRAYDAGPRGIMASACPIGLEALEAVAARAREQTGGVVEVVNLNSPRQHVLSGDARAVEEAIRILEDEHYVQAVVIERQVPMHASIFEPVGAAFRRHLETVRFERPRRPYLPNRLGRVLERPSREDFVELLATHVHRPVLFRDSIDHLVARVGDAAFIEVGPMATLHNLLDRKWHAVKRLHTDSVEDTARHFEGVVAQALEAGRGAERVS
jgi:[acyl-carrier-protein] S-malonyltransferase